MINKDLDLLITMKIVICSPLKNSNLKIMTINANMVSADLRDALMETAKSISEIKKLEE